MEMEIFELKSQLNSSELELFNYAYNEKRKKTLVAYLLYALGGLLGAHRFYLDDFLFGAVMAFCSLSALGMGIMFGNWPGRLIGFSWVVWALFMAVDSVYTAVLVKKANTKIMLDILREIHAKRDPQKTRQAEPLEIIKSNPQILSELSLNNNRLFSARGAVRSQEIRDCVSALYDALNLTIRFIKDGSAHSSVLEKIARFYLPELIKLIEEYRELENSARVQINYKERIIELIVKIEKNLESAIKDIDKEKQAEIDLSLAVLKRAMAIEGFNDANYN